MVSGHLLFLRWGVGSYLLFIYLGLGCDGALRVVGGTTPGWGVGEGN